MLSNTHFAVAIHVLCALAYNEGRSVGSEMLAASVGTNPSFLRGLVGQLRDAGLVTTKLGKGGGATLARPAAEITLADVLRATETRPVIATHACDKRSVCPVARNMEHLLENLNRRLQDVLQRELESTTVAELTAAYIEGST